ncbi:uncharacterized protein LOC133806236 [Humulus lupulus]|uniref:uncharacterized protein LOC133806236 n=1 Tax=Humulus lupulus TaxID=3486 RepID=UPI002B405C65|nr:uncharacterized protein LOC133806236 [Humulus lupulus]
MAILDVCRLNKIGIGALLETKLKGARINDVMTSTFAGWNFYSSSILEGRILLIWKAHLVKIDILQESDQLLHSRVCLLGRSHDYCISIVYGSNHLETRKVLWYDLSTVQRPVKPWIILGDFNVVFNVDDRLGGRPISVKEMEDARQWLDLGEAAEMKSLGPAYTWSNKQDGGARIFSKLDRVFSNESWSDTFPLAAAVAQWDVVSDHCFLLIKQVDFRRSGVKPFRFYNMWADNAKFRETDLSSWNALLEGQGLVKLVGKLTRLKHILKKFNWRSMGDVVCNYEESKNKFQLAQAALHSDPMNAFLLDKERVAQLDYSKHETTYASFIRQKSKITWLRFGDENSSFFMLHFKNHLGYASRFTGRIDPSCIGHGPVLNFDDQMKLIKSLTLQDVRLALFGIHSVKIPGPDGYGAGFFKTLWKDICKEVSMAVLDFFETGRIPHLLNDTLISLISKVDHPSLASDIRLIACCNTIYKCISKMLSNWLAIVLYSLINLNQGAFIKHRSLAYNVLIFQDLIKGYNRKNSSPRRTMKLDLSKAYDTIDWDFLENLLNTLFFPSQFIKLIMVCLQGSSYSLVLNGRIQGHFKGGKGLRQGDPISPLLFVIVMEYLTRLLIKASKENRFRFHPMCKSLNRISLYFADDLILFCKGTSSSVQVIREVFSEFSISSGLKINYSKIYIGGVPAEIKARILVCSKLNEGVFLLKYLGVPLRPTKWKATDWDSLWDHVLKHDSSCYWQKLISFCSSISRSTLEAVVIKGKLHLGTLYVQLLSCECIEYERTIWCKLSVPKHRFIFWHAVNQHLLTRDLLYLRHVVVASVLCPVCGLVEESHGHLFFECIFSKKVLQLVSNWLGGVTWPEKYKDWTAWITNRKSGWLHHIVAATLAASIYFIWLNRNSCYFGDSCFTIFKVDHLIRYSVKARVLNISSRHLSTRERQMIEFVNCM